VYLPSDSVADPPVFLTAASDNPAGWSTADPDRLALNIGVTAQAFTPPPAMPMLPSSSWIIAMVRMFCAPTVCCVQPSAYRKVVVLSAALVEASTSHFQEVGFRRTADILHHLRRIAGNVLFQQVPHAARIGQRFIALA
jgi:hypothetical protein